MNTTRRGFIGRLAAAVAAFAFSGKAKAKPVHQPMHLKPIDVVDNVELREGQLLVRRRTYFIEANGTFNPMIARNAELFIAPPCL